MRPYFFPAAPPTASAAASRHRRTSAATARRADRITDLAKELGDSVLPVTFDVRDRAAVAAAVAGLPAEFA